MQAQEYLQELLEDLSRDGYTSHPTKVDEFDCLHIPNIRADFVRSDILINTAIDGCSLLYAQKYVSSVKNFLRARYPFWRCALGRIGIGVIISEHEISDAVKLY